ncbi:MAG: glycosyltransferase [Prevotella sp.]|nr:glycosyltransferase [Prevotella sp.]
MANSTVSVLMSVYQSEKAEYFNRSLESNWDEQTLKPNQVVLIVDGPIGEDLNAIVIRWQEKLGGMLCVVRNEQNLGLTKSLNKGLKYVTSEYVARADSDDISMPNRFELQVNYLEQHPQIDILGGTMQEFDENNECLNVRHYPLTHEEASKYILKASPLAHPSVMMRKKIFDEGLSYNEKYRTSQDVALWFDALLAGYRIANLDETILLFRQSGGVYKRRGRSKAWNEFKIYMNGIYRMKGLFTWNYIYPVFRLAFRMMPDGIIRAVYQSNMRNKMLHG